MNIRHVRLGSATCLFLVLLSFGLQGCCKRPPATDPRPPAAPGPKAELMASLEGADVRGYLFSFDEGEGGTTASLTNPDVHDLVRLGEGEPGLVLRYTRVEDEDESTSDVFRSEVLRREDSLTLAVTDLATDEIVDEWPFPAGPACAQEFGSLTECIDQFNCALEESLLREANRTCVPQLAGLTCCLEDGTAFSVHLIFAPTDWGCRFREVAAEAKLVSQD